MGHMHSGKCSQMTLPNATPFPFGASRIAGLLVVGGALFCPRTPWLGVGRQGTRELEHVQVRASSAGTELVRPEASKQPAVVTGRLASYPTLGAGFFFFPPSVTNKNLGYQIS